MRVFISPTATSSRLFSTIISFERSFYAPNAFTPNHDGKNDLFRPLIYGNVLQYKFIVYNRWGQQVFASTQLMQGWDGTVGGTLQPACGRISKKSGSMV
jgi:gliding motility-associated-like protein